MKQYETNKKKYFIRSNFKAYSIELIKEMLKHLKNVSEMFLKEKKFLRHRVMDGTVDLKQKYLSETIPSF